MALFNRMDSNPTCSFASHASLNWSFLLQRGVLDGEKSSEFMHPFIETLGQSQSHHITIQPNVEIKLDKVVPLKLYTTTPSFSQEMKKVRNDK